MLFHINLIFFLKKTELQTALSNISAIKFNDLHKFQNACSHIQNK